MVGNDIVDIEETRCSTNCERPGFVQKIFSPREQSIIKASNDPFITVWQLWSMKESAYKVFVQAGGNPFFCPTKIKCGSSALKNAQVQIDTMTLRIDTYINSDYIFSSAKLNRVDIKTRIFKLAENNSKQQSNFMHQHLLNDFSANNSLNYTELQILKTKTGVPTIHYKNKPLSTSISFTHHGKYGAYSILDK